MLLGEIMFGLEVMVIGFTVVMVTLYLLYLILLGFSRFCAKPAKKEPGNINIQTPPPQLGEAAAPPVAATVSPQPAAGISTEVTAVISAAIAACLGTSSPGYTVTSIQPVLSAEVSAGAWSLTGRKALMERRQDLALFRRERKK